MDKKSAIITVSVTVIAVVVGLCLIYFLSNKDNSKNNVTTDKNYIGTYTLKLKDNAPDDVKGAAPSQLTLNEDNTFSFTANMCNGMLAIKGNYSVNDGTIVLENLKSREDYQSTVDLNLRGKDTLEFKIVSENEIYLVNEMFACTLSGNQYGSFIK